jgi:hypothetical protein
MKIKCILNGIALTIFSAWLSTITGNAAAQSGLARAYCTAHIPMVTQAINFRRQGIPIQVARDVVDSSFDTNVDLWNWLNYAVEEAYQNPDGVETAIRNGNALENCIENVRGY